MGAPRALHSGKNLYWGGVSLDTTSSDSPCDCVQWGWEDLAISAQRGCWLGAPAEGAQAGADLRGNLDCPCPASLLSLTGTPSPGNPGLSLCSPSTLGPQQPWKGGQGWAGWNCIAVLLLTEAQPGTPSACGSPGFLIRTWS